MKDINIIIESRNKLRKCVIKIDEEINKLRPRDVLWTEIPEATRKYLGELYKLRDRYLIQIKGINFCLNEDSKIDSYRKGLDEDMEKFIYEED